MSEQVTPPQTTPQAKNEIQFKELIKVVGFARCLALMVSYASNASEDSTVLEARENIIGSLRYCKTFEGVRDELENAIDQIKEMEDRHTIINLITTAANKCKESGAF